MTVKKIPERRCVGCGISYPKNTLIRVVKLSDGKTTEIDFTGKKSGRGAYICKNSECLKKARKAKRLERNLEVVISEDIYERLVSELDNSNDSK